MAVTKICPEDPYMYQVCGFSTEISNSGVLCGGYICPWKMARYGDLYIYIDCVGEGCKTDQRYCVLTSDVLGTGATKVCNDICDSPDCKDESNCNGYKYGVDCMWDSGNYLPVHFVCVESCHFLSSEDCSVGDSEADVCVHYDKNMTAETLIVPILNYTRCSAFDMDSYYQIPPYCLDYLDQTNCSDTERVGGICTINGFMSNVSKFVVCKHYDSYKNTSISLCDDGIQSVCIFFAASDCRIHKHKMCDGINDCYDGGDEAHDMCKKMTSPSRFACTRSFNIKHGNATIPSSWIMDNITDCLDGTDENEHGNWSYCNQRIYMGERECQDYFKCPNNRETFVSFETLCDGVESCGGGAENAVCRIARDFPDTKTAIAPLKDEMRDVCTLSLSNTACEVKEFKRPWGDAFGELRMKLVVPSRKVNCIEMFGEHYLYLSCMNLCSTADFRCPLDGERRKLEYDSCPGQFLHRSYTVGNNSFLTFLEEADNGRYHQNFFQCNNSKCVEYKQVCDLVDDCGDMSDEINCANHLICNDTLNTTKYQFIALSQRCDGIYDCFDLSDECNGGCGKEILNYGVLKFICWLSGVLATVFNVFALVMGIVSLKSCATESMMTSKVLMSLIGVGDIFIGLYLVVLSFYDSVVYGQEFCKHQIEWLTGIPCLMLGIFSLL